jgi:hypothetical protein
MGGARPPLLYAFLACRGEIYFCKYIDHWGWEGFLPRFVAAVIRAINLFRLGGEGRGVGNCETDERNRFEAY